MLSSLVSASPPDLLPVAAAVPLAAVWPGWDAGIAIATTLLVFGGLWVRRLPIELLFLGGLLIVRLTGVVTTNQALAGFSSGAVLMIGALFAAAAGLRMTGALDWVGKVLLGGATDEPSALRRLSLVAPVSAVVLNTPLVAMLAPVVIEWCRKRGVSPARLLIPLSYLTILGGVGTVIGTSTMLVCNAQLARINQPDIRLLEIGMVGAPVAVLGIAYMFLVAPRLLPKGGDLVTGLDERRREYLVEMLVQPSCGMIGQTVEEAGLRQLPGLFLIEIDRGPDVITPVTPRDVVQAGDRMVFTGVVETIADLERIPGLVPVADSTYEFQPDLQTRRVLTEAVLSRTSPVVGRTVREANFRQRYNAAIVAVHRNGERLTNKIGSIRLEPGDTLLLQTRNDFVFQHRNNRDFYLVSGIGASSARRHDRALIAGGLFLLLIVWLILSALTWDGAPMGEVLGLGAAMDAGVKPIAAMAIVVAMIVTRCMTTQQARTAIDLQVLMTIAAAIGLGTALKQSGAATFVAETLVEGVGRSGLPAATLPVVLLVVVYLVSMLLTEVITNVAVASLMIPLAVSVAVAAGLDPKPFVIGVATASSLSFATPIGYQTNLMVMGPGGYHPRDYARVGLPLALLTALTALFIIPLVWSF